MKRLMWELFGAAAIFCADRATKAWALHALQVPRDLLPGLSGELVFNKGVTWGLLSDISPFLMVLITGMVILFFIWHTHATYASKRSLLPQVLIFCGALSNLIDRIWYGAVIDFIHFHYATFSWPVFNIADVAIVCGVFMMVFQYE